MHYPIELEGSGPDNDVLAWLLELDNTPSVLPVFPKPDSPCLLVVAQLMAGRVHAEVLSTPTAVTTVCGPGVPLGRLYFQIPRDAVYSVCPGATPKTSGG